ncbi:MAG: hypothetical protein JWO06_1597 [Bacteroidota bacterium]|nr:hypothetical protein [Bacteroidota bacterium]
MNLSKYLLLFLVAISLFLAGCKKKQTANVTIQFKARFNGQNVAFDTTTFADKNNRVVRFSKFSFFLDHITLIGTDNSTTEVSTVQLIDFSNPSTLTLNFGNVKGDYKAIRFGCGLDSILNKTDPLSAAANSPLNANNIGDQYWAMLKYRFESLEGFWDYKSDTLTYLKHGMAYHLNGDSLYRFPTVVNNNFSVCCDKSTPLVLYIDMDKIFYGATETLDIPSQSGTESLPGIDNPVIANTFADNFSKTFTF